MFISNFYKTIYDNLIQKAKIRPIPHGYTETHHIIPKSLNGTNDISNLIILTAREHFICHLILCKITEGENRHKMIYAAKMMLNMKREYQDRYVPQSKIYEWLKTRDAKIKSESRKGKTYEEMHGEEKSAKMRFNKSLPRGPQKQETIDKRVKKLLGKKRTPEQCHRMSEAQKSCIREYTEEQKIMMSANLQKGVRGVLKSDSHKENISLSLKGKTKGNPKSESTKQNMRKPKSDAHRKAISEARKAKYAALRIQRVQL